MEQQEPRPRDQSPPTGPLSGPGHGSRDPGYGAYGSGPAPHDPGYGHGPWYGPQYGRQPYGSQPYEPQPSRPGPYRYVVIAAVTVVALAALALLGVLLYPRVVSATAPAASQVATPATTDAAASTVPETTRTVRVPGPTVAEPYPSYPSDPSTAGGYSCGSANGYAIHVLNGTVPCTSAQLVTTQWTTYGTTPMDGDGPAGTPYSWHCTGSTSMVGYCTSKMGSTFTISR